MNFFPGSATTSSNKAPNFAVTEIDPDLLIPLDYFVYAFDLDYANTHNIPKWSLKFDYKDFFSLPDLSPKSF